MTGYTRILWLSACVMAALLAGSAPASASYVNMTGPLNYTIYNNGTVFLGKVGPGQTFFITISANTTNSTGARFSRGWDELLASNLPPGWVAENSSLYLAYEFVKITPPPDTTTGIYQLNLTAVNIGNYSKLGSLHFTALINVTPDVFKLGVSPAQVSTGPGEPIPIYISVNNTGVSDSPFVISASGLPAWNTTEQVIALHHTTGVFQYPIYEDEPGNYTANITVSSLESPLIRKSTVVGLTVQASLAGDYSALGEGALAFPVIYEPAYAVMYIISRIFG